MSADESPDGSPEDRETESRPAVRDRLEQEADRAVEQFDEGIVDLLAWLLDTETRARIYVHLRSNPDSTSQEIAEGTGLYPSTVREALAELHEEETVSRQKRENDGAGNNPYEYAAIPPSELVSEVIDEVQQQLNTVFNLDRLLQNTDEAESEPVTITVTEEVSAGEEDAVSGDAPEEGDSNGDEDTDRE